MAASDFTFGLTDYVVCAVMLLASSGIGIYFGFFAKSKNTPQEYLMGGKKMKTIPIAISLIASQLSPLAVTSIPAETYAFGFNYMYLVLGILPVIPVLIYILAPVFYENRFNNCYEYLEKRFNKPTRQVVTASFILNALLILPIFMFIPSLAFSQVSGINIHLINTVVCSICMFYTILGGIKAVVYTDVLQAGFVLASAIVVGVVGIMKTGGMEKVIEYAGEGGRLDTDLSLDPRVRITAWNAFFSGLMMWIGHIGLNQSCVQRITSLPSLGQAQRALLITGIGITCVMAFNSFIGCIMFAFFHNCDPIKAGHVERPDKMMPFFVQNIVGHLKGMPGLFIACVFSASLSTLSAYLNSAAGLIYFDAIKPFVKHTDSRANFVIKAIVLVIGCYCIACGFLVQNFQSTLQMLLTFTGIKTGGLVALFLLGIFVPRINGKAALTSFSVTIIGMIWLVANAQLRMKSGRIKYVPLPTNTDDCDALNIENLGRNVTNAQIYTHQPQLENETFSFYEISFYWYKILGLTCTCVLAILLSFVWKPDHSEKQDPKLYSPFVRKFLRKTPVSELEEMTPFKKQVT